MGSNPTLSAGNQMIKANDVHLRQPSGAVQEVAEARQLLPSVKGIGKFPGSNIQRLRTCFNRK